MAVPTTPATRGAKQSMNKISVDAKTYRGGCHCGQVAFEVVGVLEDVSECNCSICTRKGYLHWIVPRDSFRLLTPMENLATYRFNTGVAQHHFCPACGVAAFYIPRSDPDKIDVNVRCIEGVELAEIPIRKFDGRNWEAALRERDRGDRSAAGAQALVREISAFRVPHPRIRRDLPRLSGEVRNPSPGLAFSWSILVMVLPTHSRVR